MAARLMEESKQVEKKRRLKTIISIPDGDEPIEEEKQEPEERKDTLEIGTDPFTKEQLQETFNQFSLSGEFMKLTDSQRMILKQPQEINGNVLQIILSNELQVDILMKFHLELVTFLRKKLNNKTIEVAHTVTKVEREDMLYTNTEKFNFIMKTNPNLAVLKSHLGLDPEI